MQEPPDPIERLRALVDDSVLPGADRYTLDEVAGRAGADPQLTRRLWRALGFADPAPEDRIGGEIDVEVLRLALDQPLTSDGVETMIRQTRIMSAAIARIAELWVDQARVTLDAGGTPQLDELVETLGDLDRTMGLIDYMHRRLLAAGLRRELANRRSGGGTDQTAVFADLVGFTTLTERIGPLELAELVGSFEACAYDTVAEHGGRVVKTIGDEVLFAADDPATALDTAVVLLHRAAERGLPPLRAGIDHGSAVWFEGDLFGATVNRAARLVAEAPAGTIAASTAVRSALPERTWRAAGDRHLKGVGVVPLFLLDAIDPDGAPATVTP